ncbi:hypothetical protein O6H91_09G102000 [Diphasiastrum complanatum]|uniref:Uncharacterized protein n=1 Tax=Diphasiastrum complanatum TaxID=34168 RepID=A0ACC2CSR5_DIPCM|nr:hypothetical protein O6H91_09G102000 [Diphasiastrum complanatum]
METKFLYSVSRENISAGSYVTLVSRRYHGDISHKPGNKSEYLCSGTFNSIASRCRGVHSQSIKLKWEGPGNAKFRVEVSNQRGYSGPVFKMPALVYQKGSSSREFFRDLQAGGLMMCQFPVLRSILVFEDNLNNDPFSCFKILVSQRRSKVKYIMNDIKHQSRSFLPEAIKSKASSGLDSITVVHSGNFHKPDSNSNLTDETWKIQSCSISKVSANVSQDRVARQDKQKLSCNFNYLISPNQALIRVGMLYKQGNLREGLQVLMGMSQKAMLKYALVYVHLLRECGKKKVLRDGKQIHNQVISCRLEGNAYIASALISMYAKCGSLQDARMVFDKTPNMNIVSWTAMIAGYAKQGDGEEAMALFLRMKRQRFQPDKVTFIWVLNACASVGCLEQGKQIHDEVIEAGLESDIFVATALVDMYSKCGCLVLAQNVFDKMPERNLVSWNAMIAGHVKHGSRIEEALNLSEQLKCKGLKADAVTYVSLVGACARFQTLDRGKQVHAEILAAGLESNIFVGTALIDMYSKCGSLLDARQVFDRMPMRNVVAWNAMIAGYAKHGDGNEALKLFQCMKYGGVRPDGVTFVEVLCACSRLAALEQGRQVHSDIIKGGYHTDIFVGTALVDMYAKCGSLAQANKVLHQMTVRNVISWNALLAGYTKLGKHNEVLELFWKMKLENIVPDEVTFSCILNACNSHEALEAGKQIHAEIIERGLHSDVFMGNALINMYSNCGSILQARRVFDGMHTPNVVSWTSMATAYVKHGDPAEALRLCKEMQEDGLKPDEMTFVCMLDACTKLGALEMGMQIHSDIIEAGFESNVFIGTSLINMYGKCGSFAHAIQTFDFIPTRNTITWNAVISMYSKHGRSMEALAVFKKMKQEGFKPDGVTFVCILNACASLTALEQGQQVHVDIVEAGYESDIFVGNALIDMYAKCGDIEQAFWVFNQMPEKNIISWNAIIAGFCIHAHSAEALRLFRKMQEQQLKPDKITFVSLLSLCSHLGLVERGRGLFDSMIRDYGLEPSSEHYGCLTDLLGRAGLLKEAEHFIAEMPIPPHISNWMSLLGACRIHTNLELAESTARNILKLEPRNSAACVLMSNIYAMSGKWDKVMEWREMMKEKE